jgi:hypothetical protein
MVALALLAAFALVVALVATRVGGSRAPRTEPEWLDFLRWELDHR